MGYDCDLIQGLGLGSRNGVWAPLHPCSRVGVLGGWLVEPGQGPV